MSSSSDLNPYNNNFASVIISDAVCSFVAAVFICLRLYVRRTLVRQVRLDDWLLLAGVIFFIISNVLDAISWSVLQSEGVVAGSDLSDELGAICMIPYIVSEIFIRAAYAVFYLGVIPSELDLRWQRWVIYVSFGIYGVLQIMCIFVITFRCGSPANMVSTDPSLGCLNSGIMNFVYDAPYYLDAILDWLMALIPVWVVWKSTMTRKTKISAAFILLLGCVASVLGVIVIPLSYLDSSISGGYDFSMAIIVDILGTCESLVAIACLSLAASKPLFRKFLDQASTARSTSAPSSQEIRLIAPGLGILTEDKPSLA